MFELEVFIWGRGKDGSKHEFDEPTGGSPCSPRVSDGDSQEGKERERWFPRMLSEHQDKGGIRSPGFPARLGRSPHPAAEL